MALVFAITTAGAWPLWKVRPPDALIFWLLGGFFVLYSGHEPDPFWSAIVAGCGLATMIMAWVLPQDKMG